MPPVSPSQIAVAEIASLHKDIRCVIGRSTLFGQSGVLRSTSANCLTRGGTDDDLVAVRVKLLATVAATAGVDDVDSIAREIAAAGSDGVCVLSVVFIVSMNEIPVLEIGYAVEKR